MRFATGRIEIRRNDTWRPALAPRTRVRVSMLAIPWLARYGYLRAAAPAPTRGPGPAGDLWFPGGSGWADQPAHRRGLTRARWSSGRAGLREPGVAGGEEVPVGDMVEDAPGLPEPGRPPRRPP